MLSESLLQTLFISSKTRTLVFSESTLIRCFSINKRVVEILTSEKDDQSNKDA